jgi:hypothetical protein
VIYRIASLALPPNIYQSKYISVQTAAFNQPTLGTLEHHYVEHIRSELHSPGTIYPWYDGHGQ